MTLPAGSLEGDSFFDEKRRGTMVNRKFYCFTVTFLMLSVLLCGCGEAAGEDVILIGNAASDGEESALETTGGEPAQALGTPVQTSGEPPVIRVYVCGAVDSPGVVEIPQGSRAEDALSAAGGFAPEAAREAVNLADWVSDGQMLYFPTEEELETAGQPLQEEQKGLVNINTADMALLCTLPGIGETRAAEIIAYRDAHGSFASCEELMQVSGIKAGIYEKVCDKITVK